VQKRPKDDTGALSLRKELIEMDKKKIKEILYFIMEGLTFWALLGVICATYVLCALM